jgi:hypothetical protein
MPLPRASAIRKMAYVSYSLCPPFSLFFAICYSIVFAYLLFRGVEKLRLEVQRKLGIGVTRWHTEGADHRKSFACDHLIWRMRTFMLHKMGAELAGGVPVLSGCDGRNLVGIYSSHPLLYSDPTRLQSTVRTGLFQSHGSKRLSMID